MTAIDYLRLFKNKMILKVSSKTGWSKNELIEVLDDVYTEILEEMISPTKENK